ncbi:hypothetical protein N658DRAFT_298435 [Parathielavia hyrcaniae]|uniref:Uncharacterized protein n=1 Tax=Parathielavia hyrcaniae TaxID=113614 RepID=A0AAN6Q3V5_9PEZI|nr:hypothetical protein N658DRAFT_298435 [Parathielavia hyrcaniae]
MNQPQTQFQAPHVSPISCIQGIGSMRSYRRNDTAKRCPLRQSAAVADSRGPLLHHDGHPVHGYPGGNEPCLQTNPPLPPQSQPLSTQLDHCTRSNCEVHACCCRNGTYWTAARLWFVTAEKIGRAVSDFNGLVHRYLYPISSSAFHRNDIWDHPPRDGRGKARSIVWTEPARAHLDRAWGQSVLSLCVT